MDGLNSSLAIAAGELWPKKCRPLSCAGALKGFAMPERLNFAKFLQAYIFSACSHCPPLFVPLGRTAFHEVSEKTACASQTTIQTWEKGFLSKWLTCRSDTELAQYFRAQVPSQYRGFIVALVKAVADVSVLRSPHSFQVVNNQVLPANKSDVTILKQGSLRHGPRAKSGSGRFLSTMKKYCFYETYVDYAECNISRNNHIT